MNKSRLEAFSDGVFAIIITIMVLELKIPESTELAVLKRLIPMFISYVLSFLFIGIYWNNHHHLMHTAKKINASIMWANMHLLFWFSLVPFCTGWMGRTNFDKVTVAAYGVLLIFCGIGYTILSNAITNTHKEKTNLTRALEMGKTKGWVSLVLYGLSVPVALFVHPLVYAVLFAFVAIMWLIPSKAIEKALDGE
jgi:uncharacterized membrane protein